MDDTNHIIATQLFYELKQQFPAVPDNVVKYILRQANYDKDIAVKLLTVESQLYTTAAQGAKRNPLGTSPVTQRSPRALPPPLPVTPPMASTQISSATNCPTAFRPSADVSQQHVPQVASPGSSTVHLFCNNNVSQVVTFPTTPPLSAGPQPGSPLFEQQLQQQKRASTSVSLVLQPSPDHAPFVSYTSASVDPQRGLQSHLQITISNQGGSITAVRGNPTLWFVGEPPSQSNAIMHPSVQWPIAIQTSPKQMSLKDTITEQSTRRERLQRSLQQEETKLDFLQRDVHQLQEELTKEKELLGPDPSAASQRNRGAAARRPEVVSVIQDIENLKEEIRNLGLDCQRMVMEIESFGNDQVPLGNDTSNGPTTPTSETGGDLDDDDDEEGWNCNECTLRNHPALNKCEACETPRSSPAASSSAVAPIAGITRHHNSVLHYSHTNCYCHKHPPAH